LASGPDSNRRFRLRRGETGRFRQICYLRGELPAQRGSSGCNENRLKAITERNRRFESGPLHHSVLVLRTFLSTHSPHNDNPLAPHHSVSRRKLKAISTRPSQPPGGGRVENRALDPQHSRSLQSNHLGPQRPDWKPRAGSIPSVLRMHPGYRYVLLAYTDRPPG